MDNAIKEKQLQKNFLVHRADLVRGLEPVAVLDCMQDLFPAGFDTYQEIAEVEGIGRNERSRRLLNALATRGITGYKRMIRALCQCGQRHLAELVAGELYPELLEDPIPADRTHTDGLSATFKHVVQQPKSSELTPNSPVNCLFNGRPAAVFQEVCRKLDAKDSPLIRTWPALLAKLDLGISADDVKEQCSNNMTDQLIKAWHAQQGGQQATIGALLQFLWDINRRDCIDRINDLLVTKWEVPTKDSNKKYPMVPEDTDLHELASELGKDTATLADYLGVNYSTIQKCFDENPSSIIQASFQMLITWKREKEGKPDLSFDTIFEQLRKMDHISVIKKFKKSLDAR